MKTLQGVLEHIDIDRLAQLSLKLVKIPSPTLNNHQVAEAFATVLQSLGMEVECHRHFPESTLVVGRLRGQGGGQTLEFNGHLDHVPVDHPEPEIRDGILYGRGSFDMKANLASVVEALAALVNAGVRLKGDVLITAQGLHEAPGPYEHSEDRQILLRDGVHGDACVVVEGPSDSLPIRFGGLSVFQLTISRSGPITHELRTEPGTPNPLYLAARLAAALEEQNREFAKEQVPLLGPDSYHLGILRGGDYFNRFPNECHLEGTRRYHPGRSYNDCLVELRQLVDGVLQGTDVSCTIQLKDTAKAADLPATHPFVNTFQRAVSKVEGKPLQLTGMRLATDVLLYLKHGVPALCHGPAGGGAHEDLEWVPLDELARCSRLWAALMIEFCEVAN